MRCHRGREGLQGKGKGKGGPEVCRQRRRGFEQEQVHLDASTADALQLLREGRSPNPSVARIRHHRLRPPAQTECAARSTTALPGRVVHLDANPSAEPQLACVAAPPPSSIFSHHGWAVHDAHPTGSARSTPWRRRAGRGRAGACPAHRLGARRIARLMKHDDRVAAAARPAGRARACRRRRRRVVRTRRLERNAVRARRGRRVATAGGLRRPVRAAPGPRRGPVARVEVPVDKGETEEQVGVVLGLAAQRGQGSNAIPGTPLPCPRPCARSRIRPRPAPLHAHADPARTIDSRGQAAARSNLVDDRRARLRRLRRERASLHLARAVRAADLRSTHRRNAPSARGPCHAVACRAMPCNSMPVPVPCRASAMPGQCHAGAMPVPCRASAMACRASAGSAMPGCAALRFALYRGGR